MKIGVMSNSNDNLPLIAKAVQLFNRQKVGLLLHAGDFVSPLTANMLKEPDATAEPWRGSPTRNL